MNDLTFFFPSRKGCCHDNQFCAKIREIGLPHLYSSHCHSEMDWYIEFGWKQ